MWAAGQVVEERLQAVLGPSPPEDPVRAPCEGDEEREGAVPQVA